MAYGDQRQTGRVHLLVAVGVDADPTVRHGAVIQVVARAVHRPARKKAASHCSWPQPRMPPQRTSEMTGMTGVTEQGGKTRTWHSPQYLLCDPMRIISGKLSDVLHGKRMPSADGPRENLESTSWLLVFRSGMGGARPPPQPAAAAGQRPRRGTPRRAAARRRRPRPPACTPRGDSGRSPPP